jgi:opacity protein-like surface antigen
LKSTDFSVGVGAGFNFTPSVGVGLRYNLGLSNISDAENSDLKTGNFSIGLHYNFGASK